MIVYLDMNKWIELGRIIYGKDISSRSNRIKKTYSIAKTNGYIFTLSAMHYIEFSRIANLGRRKRLGKVMWEYSEGITLAWYSNIIEREIEVALSQLVPSIIPRDLLLTDFGIDHAFGTNLFKNMHKEKAILINKSMLMGNEEFQFEPLLSSHIDKYPKYFMNYQNELKNKKEQLGDNSIENLIYALSMKDIVDPINRVLVKHNIDKSALSNLSCEQCKKFMDTMPTRRLDIHLHKQIFKNPNYRPKETDIGDWGGIGIASCYCDIVICEKHFADLLRREKYIPHARIETDLDNLILDVNPIKKPIKT